VEEVERLGGAILGGLRERCSTLLPRQVRVADVLDVLDRWQAADHAITPHLLQSLEAEVAEPRMPPPLIVVVACREAHRFCRPEWKYVQVIR
jgi:hypothetical protein